MFRMKATMPQRGDCTCRYKIILDKEYTVKEFIETVLKEKSGEWGYFGIYNDKGDFSAKVFGEPCCEYRYGKLSTSPLPDEYLDKKIIKVTGDGGWSRMDYLFWVE